MRFPRSGSGFRLTCILLALALLPAGGRAADAVRSGPGDAEISRSVQGYTAQVFGSRAPMLADYQQLEAPAVNAELRLELKECERVWGVAFFEHCGEAILDKRCEEWIAQRSEQPAVSESLYYRLLRQHVRPAAIEVVGIQRPASAGLPYTVTARSTTGQQLVFQYAPVPGAGGKGAVGLVSVDGTPVEQLLQQPAKSAQR